MKDARVASWARAEQIARDLTYHADQQFTSDGLFQVPPDAMRGRKTGTGVTGTIPSERSAETLEIFRQYYETLNTEKHLADNLLWREHSADMLGQSPARRRHLWRGLQASMRSTR